MAIASDLLEILRCPYCVSGDTRKSGDDPGLLELTSAGTWLLCQETDCERKYPIRENIPVMLIDEGDKWSKTAVGDLPDPGNLVDRLEISYWGLVIGEFGCLRSLVYSFVTPWTYYFKT